ncbi:hypothetical protein PsAD5_00337 [Pseudovibrio sp. Ad5]|nr:hypothetical protein PsAD5_00337 [Pseudovibrio sp. Ad5]
MVVQSDSQKHMYFSNKKLKKISQAFVIAVGAIGLTACMSQINRKPSTWYTQMGGIENKGDTLYICHGFGCEYRTAVTFSQKDKQRLRTILKRGHRSPEAERAAISKAVQWQEKRVGPAVGSSNDIGGLDMGNGNVKGQMDCIDEATNTTSLLVYAGSQGWLKYHRAARPASRGFFLDGKYPHASAVVVDTTTEIPWVVDSWRLSNGKPPDILHITKWLTMTSADLENPSGG